MYSARDAVDNEEWVEDLSAAADELGLSDRARATATDLFLSSVPERERSKRATAAASLYAGSLVAGEGRSQSEAADAVGASRLAVQDHWKDVLREAGFQPPDW